MKDQIDHSSTKTEKPVIRILYESNEQSEIATHLASCLNETTEDRKPLATTAPSPSLPSRLGGSELIIELIVARVATRFIIQTLISAIVLFVEKFHPHPETVLIIRLLFPEEKGKKLRKTKDFELGVELKEAVLDALQKSIEKELSSWLGGNEK
jgi:hypothetical protein